MKRRVSIVLMILFFTTGYQFVFSQQREVVNLVHWKFVKGNHPDAFQSRFNDASWENITVPHDWAINGPFIPDGDGNTGKLPWKGEAWYRHYLDVSQACEGKRLYLVFDGVMAFPVVYVNGIKAGSWDYGYNSFYLDITEYVKYGKQNMIAVHADTRLHDSRWYPGAGIYRKVQLHILPAVHVDIWGTQITTPVIKSNYAKVNVISSVSNQSITEGDSITVLHQVLSPAGGMIAQNAIKRNIQKGHHSHFESTLTIYDPQKWDIGAGVLYSIVTAVHRGNEMIDSDTSSFGIRSIRFTADDGFYLNDRRVQLKGVNLHHDHGPLGAAFYPRAMERQLEIMQEMGCNAIRNSHNTAAPEVLELCDRMGILVLNEIFDKYDQKADILPETDFEEFAERNMRNFVMRDRNHPSVFLWSVGNEIGDVQWNIKGGFEKLRTMVHAVRKYDHSRPVTLVCDSRGSAVLRHFDYYDVHSWNYGRRYDLARQLEPNKAVIISESASTVSTRGFYEWPLPADKTEFTKSLQVSSYDLNAPEWAEVADDDFKWQQEENYIAGEFVWTGFDYLGEPTPYQNSGVRQMGMKDEDASVSSYFGIVDLVGIPKDRFYLYKSYWKPEDTTIHILPHWTWPGKEGQNIPVFVYTNGDCAELFLNGVSHGMKCKNVESSNSIQRYRLMWNDIVYEPGIVKVKAYKHGTLIGEQALETTGPPVHIRLTPDRTVLNNDGMDLSYILVEALDEKGRLCPDAHHLVTFKILGPSSIAGVGNGNPQSMDLFVNDEVRLFYGKAMLILRGGSVAGETKVIALSEGLKGDEVGIRIE